ncbi:MAK10-like protein [Tanacetum coccineum]
MGDENHIRTLGDYSKPSHEGYRNTIELPAGNNVERTRLHLFQFSLRYQATNWLKRLSAGSITTLEDLTTHFLAQFFPQGRTAKLCNDILIRTIDQSAGGKLRDRNAKESWALLEDLALYDNESWNDLRDFAKPFKAISLPQDVPSIFDRHIIELENQVQRLKEAHLASTQLTQVNKITTSCEICSAPYDTQYCMEDPEQALLNKHPRVPMKQESPFIQREVPAKIEDPGLFTLPYRPGDSKPFDTLADLGSYVNIIPLYLFKKLNIGLLEKTDHIFGLADKTKSYPVRIVKDVEVHIGKLKLLNDFYVIDIKKDPEPPLLVGRGFLATANAIIDCRMAKIAVEEGITRSVFRVKGVNLGEEEAPY